MAQFSRHISSCEILISASLPEVIPPTSSKNEICKNKCKYPQSEQQFMECVILKGLRMYANLLEYH